MDCNKDEANRAKEIAESKFLAKDIVGAKRFALKAHNLYPGIDGIAHMLATLDVYISAENKLNGESDWYGILGVNPKANDKAVWKQYMKLALTLHPGKSKSVGAEGAFRLISKAWSLLSDKAKRMEYDKRKAKTAASTNKPPLNPNTNTNTFWTLCHICKMRYEYLRIYLNHNLLCPNCHQPFHAEEIAAPPISIPLKEVNFNKPSSNSYNQSSNFPFSGNGGASIAAQVKRGAAMKGRVEALRRKQTSKRSSNLGIRNSDPAKRRKVMD